MSTLWLLFIILSLLASAAAFTWVALSINGSLGKKKNQDFIDQANQEVERIFSDEFREELRNRGRLHFEQIISENAMFLKQDLQLTASDLNKYMQEQIKKVLKEEFKKYEESIEAAKDVAIQSIEKTQQALEEQRAMLQQQMQEQIEKEKAQVIEAFMENLTQIINHYVLEAIGSEIDLDDQLDYIYRHLEENKDEILEDIRSGA